jgi:predicted TIM-barrel enzyme
MVHLDALPGAPLHDADCGMARIVKNARAGWRPFQG